MLSLSPQFDGNDCGFFIIISGPEMVKWFGVDAKEIENEESSEEMDQVLVKAKKKITFREKRVSQRTIM